MIIKKIDMGSMFRAALILISPISNPEFLDQNNEYAIVTSEMHLGKNLCTSNLFSAVVLQ